MKKQTNIVTSFKDAGYQSAKHGEGMASVARFVLDGCPSFIDAVPDEIKVQLREGHALRWQELNPAKTFNHDWIPVEGGGNLVSLAYCLSFSQQAFGQLKTDHPVQHGVIKDVRDKFNKYSSNVMGDLKRAVRKLVNDGKPKERVQAKQFDTYLKDMFDDCKARCKTATARNDDTAPSEIKLRQAIDAFYAKLNA